MKYLVNVVETYRVDTEEEAKQAIEEAKKDRTFTLVKYSSEYKERKQKGEVIDSYFKLSLTKAFNDIKEPDTFIKVNYSTSCGVQPSEEDDFEVTEEGINF